MKGGRKGKVRGRGKRGRGGGEDGGGEKKPKQHECQETELRHL